MSLLTDRLKEYIAAAFTGLWIQSHEHDDALNEIARLCQAQQWLLATWDIDRGLRPPDRSTDGAAHEQGGGDPLAALHALAGMTSPDEPDSSTLLVMSNLPGNQAGGDALRLACA